MPSPLAISRTPSTRMSAIVSSSSSTPTICATLAGAAICANPNPRLNQPRARASRSMSPFIDGCPLLCEMELAICVDREPLSFPVRWPC